MGASRMARIDTPADPSPSSPSRSSVSSGPGDDRLEVTGRWFGVRGQPLHAPDAARARRRPPPAPDRGAGPQAVGRRHRGHMDRRLRLARGARRRHHPAARGLPGHRARPPAPGADAAGATLTPRPRPSDAPRKPPAPRRDPPPPEPAASEPEEPVARGVATGGFRFARAGVPPTPRRAAPQPRAAAPPRAESPPPAAARASRRPPSGPRVARRNRGIGPHRTTFLPLRPRRRARPAPATSPPGTAATASPPHRAPATPRPMPRANAARSRHRLLSSPARR